MKKITAFVIILFIFSCQSSEKRFQRVAEDANIYETFTKDVGIAYHIDAECEKIKQATWFQPISKKTLDLNYDGRVLYNNNYITFCPSCTKMEDIEKLKSQIEFWESSKVYKKVQKKGYDIQLVLYDFDATIQAHPEYSENELLQKFPEFGNDRKKLQAAYDYSATLNSGKYMDVNEFNSKFPEFFP